MNKISSTCQKFQELFIPYLTGKLESPFSRRLEEHLTLCESCRTAFRDEKRWLNLLRSVEEINPPPGLRIRVERGLQRLRLTPPRRVNPWVWKGGVALAFASILLLLVWLPWRKSTPPTGPEPTTIEEAFFLQFDEPSGVIATLVSETAEGEEPSS